MYLFQKSYHLTLLVVADFDDLNGLSLPSVMVVQFILLFVCYCNSVCICCKFYPCNLFLPPYRLTK